MNGFFTSEFVIRLITSLIGTVSFAVVFRVRPIHLPYAGICGLITYAVFYTVGFFGDSLFVAAFAAASFTALFSEICARVRKAPAIVFLIPGSIPIVPGGDLYNMMKYLLSSEFDLAFEYMLIALKTGIGIAGGIVAVSVAWRLVFHGKKEKIPFERQ